MYIVLAPHRCDGVAPGAGGKLLGFGPSAGCGHADAGTPTRGGPGLTKQVPEPVGKATAGAQRSVGEHDSNLTIFDRVMMGRGDVITTYL